MTDLHDLIRRMADELDHYRQLLCDDRTERHALATEARAALAELQGEGPTDEELDELFTEIDQSGKSESWRAYARAVLARWGRPAPPPADDGPAVPEGREPASVVDESTADDLVVDELVSRLRTKAATEKQNACHYSAILLTRAADLLTRLALQPVPVSERLPGAEDCDAEGFCWWFSPADSTAGAFGVAACWVLRKYEPEDDFRTHWLPAHALPLPREVQP